MCHFILLSLPKTADLKGCAAIFEAHTVAGFNPIHNESLVAQLEPGETLIRASRTQCNCGTPLGSLARDDSAGLPDRNKQIQKRRKQGWSQAKIDRWLAEQDQTGERREARQLSEIERDMPQIEGWLAFLRALLNADFTRRVGLLLHWYKHAPETERVVLERQEDVPLSELDAETLLHIEENVIYQFTSSVS